MIEEKALRDKIFKLINDKKSAMIEFATNHLELVGKDISILNNYIKSEIELCDENIIELLSNLVQYRVVLNIPVPVDTLLLRAVKIDDPLKYPKRYNNANRISYIPESLSYKAKLNRFNKDNQSMYYGSISRSKKNANVAFSEIKAKENEHINILVSKTSKELEVRFIGLFDYYKRGTEPPFQVHSFFKEVYQHYQKTHEEELLMAIELCDAFFSDITTRKGHERLYQVTSTLSAILLDDTHVDGLIYPSVETIGSPNVVLKPNSVDNKVKHKEAHISLIKKDYGYSVYYAIDFNDIGIIDKNNIITWNTK